MFFILLLTILFDQNYLFSQDFAIEKIALKTMFSDSDFMKTITNKTILRKTDILVLRDIFTNDKLIIIDGSLEQALIDIMVFMKIKKETSSIIIAVFRTYTKYLDPFLVLEKFSDVLRMKDDQLDFVDFLAKHKDEWKILAKNREWQKILFELWIVSGANSEDLLLYALPAVIDAGLVKDTNDLIRVSKQLLLLANASDYDSHSFFQSTLKVFLEGLKGRKNIQKYWDKIVNEAISKKGIGVALVFLSHLENKNKIPVESVSKILVEALQISVLNFSEKRISRVKEFIDSKNPATYIFDIDGTLTDSEDIAEEMIAKISILLILNKNVVLASGRDFENLQKVREQIRQYLKSKNMEQFLSNIYLAPSNGLNIFKIDNNCAQSYKWSHPTINNKSDVANYFLTDGSVVAIGDNAELGGNDRDMLSITNENFLGICVGQINSEISEISEKCVQVYRETNVKNSEATKILFDEILATEIKKYLKNEKNMREIDGANSLKISFMLELIEENPANVRLMQIFGEELVYKIFFFIKQILRYNSYDNSININLNSILRKSA
jgi:hydroxymethylpyrimidine pyrophosphatase-like HAD family hydrolase